MRQKNEPTLTREEAFKAEIADLKQRNSIKASVYRAFRAAAHLKTFGERFKAYAEAELQGYTIHILVSKDQYHPTGIRVWGKGIDHSYPLDLTWYTEAGKTWQDQFQRQLDRKLFEERIESLEYELATFDIFVLHEKDVQLALEKVAELRTAALMDVPGGDPSPALKRAFPLLFE